MRAELRKDLTAALKARDHVAIGALRSALAAIDNAEAVSVDSPIDNPIGNTHVAKAALGLGAAEVERRHLTEADVRAIIQNEIQERLLAAEQYNKLGRTDLVERLRDEVEVLNRYVESAP